MGGSCCGFRGAGGVLRDGFGLGAVGAEDDLGGVEKLGAVVGIDDIECHSVGDAGGVVPDVLARIEFGQMGHKGIGAGGEDDLLVGGLCDLFTGAAVVIGILKEIVDFRFGGKEDGEVTGLATALEGGIAVWVGTRLGVVAHDGLQGRIFEQRKRRNLRAAPSVFPLYDYCRKRTFNYVQSGRKMLAFRMSGLEKIFDLRA